MFSFRFSHIFLLSMGFLLFLYLVYHLMSGEYSIYRWIDNEPQIVERELELERLRQRRLELENLTYRLRDKSLDLDLLEEETRRKLYYLDKNEVIIDLPK